jgi:hypothetical protein
MGSILECPPVASVMTAVEELKAAIGNVTSLVAAGRLEGLSESELLVVVVDLQGMGSQVEAVTVAAVAEVRDGEVARCEGFTSMMRFLASKAGCRRAGRGLRSRSGRSWRGSSRPRGWRSSRVRSARAWSTSSRR